MPLKVGDRVTIPGTSVLGEITRENDRQVCVLISDRWGYTGLGGYIGEPLKEKWYRRDLVTPVLPDDREDRAWMDDLEEATQAKLARERAETYDYNHRED